MLYVADIVFTGDKPGKDRPKPAKVVIKARNIDLAIKIIARFAKRRWPYYRFEIEQCDHDSVLEYKPYLN